MDKTFRSQTTELVVTPPFKGKGLVNDRLRFDVSGLSPSNDYTLVYNGSTGTISWQNVDSAGVDTIYSDDATITEDRTVTLDTNISLNIRSIEGGMYFWAENVDNENEYAELDINKNGISAYKNFNDGGDISYNTSIDANANGFNLYQGYTDNGTPSFNEEYSVYGGIDTEGIIIRHSVDEASRNSGISLLSKNTGTNDETSLVLKTDNSTLASIDLYVANGDGSYEGVMSFNGTDGLLFSVTQGETGTSTFGLLDGNMYLSPANNLIIKNKGRYVALMAQDEPTTATSGSLIVGETYTLTTYVAGDDFANVANVQTGTINVTGCVFIATGTTPTNWTNGSTLDSLGAPRVRVLENSLSGPIIWTRDGVGSYVGTLNSAFTSNSVAFIQAGNYNGDTVISTAISAGIPDTDTVQIYVYDDTGTPMGFETGNSYEISVMIEVYPE